MSEPSKRAPRRRLTAEELRVQRAKNPRTCSFDGCDHTHMALGLCSMHYQRVKKGGDLGPPRPVKAPRGESLFIDGKGYALRTHPGSDRQVRVHREVMSEILGRPLERFEHVHHKNGVRTDNRPENLELWLHYQPSGQRVCDLVAWAREILDRYGDAYPEAA